MFIYDYALVTMATISFSLLLDVLTIVLRFVISRANRREVMCKNKISKLLEVHAWLHYTKYTTEGLLSHFQPTKSSVGAMVVELAGEMEFANYGSVLCDGCVSVVIQYSPLRKEPTDGTFVQSGASSI